MPQLIQDPACTGIYDESAPSEIIVKDGVVIEIRSINDGK